ncbi:hypothetical protein [Domibacillus antri]|uniref:hypothetical protein n=1 Tax=Domibacillus antri TaxID=1714264 RepID=UPI000B1BD14D|nr:hypothetical protein [Domibacillus antri]
MNKQEMEQRIMKQYEQDEQMMILIFSQLNVLSMYGNDDLAFVAAEEIRKRKK